jgi:hypothetical protein
LGATPEFFLYPAISQRNIPDAGRDSVAGLAIRGQNLHLVSPASMCVRVNLTSHQFLLSALQISAFVS